MTRMRRLILLSILCMAAAVCAAQEPAEIFRSANRAYEQGDYQEARQLYEQLLETGASPGVTLYNLGNTYYKLGRPGMAVLMYERALRSMPRDEDLRHNLEIARPALEPSRSIVSRFTRGLLGAITISEAAWISAAWLWLACLGAVGMLLGAQGSLYGFWKKLTIVLAVCFALSAAVLAMKYYDTSVRKYGVVVADRPAPVFSGPDAKKYDNLANLPPGARVIIIGTSYEGWKRIRFGTTIDGYIEEGKIKNV